VEIKRPTLMFDVMHNVSVRETHHDNVANGLSRGQVYGRGVVVGVVSALVAMGYTFQQALDVAIKYAGDLDVACLPPTWKKS